MRKIDLKNKKKVTTALVTCAVIAVSTVGAAAAVRKTTGGDSRVLVAPVSEIAGGWWNDSGSVEGMADSGTTQKIYAGGAETIREIRVKEGDTVKKGDILLTYDSAKTNLNLEKEKLDQQAIQLQIDTAEKNLVTLSKLKPFSEPVQPDDADSGVPDENDISGNDEIPDSIEDKDGENEPDDPSAGQDTEVPDDKDDGKQPGGQDDGKLPDDQDGKEQPGDESVIAGKAVLNPSLSSDASYFWSEGGTAEPGSEGNPYRFLVSAGATVDAGFIHLLSGLKKNTDGDAYFLLEIREGGSVSGKLIRIWAENAADLSDVSDGWTSEIPKSGSFILPEKAKDDGAEDGGTEDGGNKKDQQGDSPQKQDGDSGTEKNPLNADSGTEKNAADAEQKNELVSFASVMTAYSSASNSGSSAEGASQSGENESGQDSSPDGSENTISGGGITLIPQDAKYSKEELADAKREQQDALRDLRLDYRESELKVKKAEQALSDCEVKATVDGIVRKAGDPQNPPKDGSPILEIAAESGMTVQGGLSEDQYSQVHIGDTVTVQSYMSGTTCEAEITSISPYPDTTNRFGDSSKTWYPFTAVLNDENAEIGEGEWLSITFDNTGDGQDTALMLDQAFVRTDEGSPYVYIDENGTLKKQNVVLGKLAGGMYEIRSGLTQEDQIAFPYGKNTRDGAKTKPGTAEQIYSN